MRYPRRSAAALLAAVLCGAWAARAPSEDGPHPLERRLPPGTALLGKDLDSAFKLLDLETPDPRGRRQPLGEVRVVSATGRNYGQVLRVRVFRKVNEVWRLQLLAPLVAQVAKGQNCVLHFVARSVVPTIENGEAQVNVFFQQSQPDYARSLSQPLRLGKDWQEYWFTFQAAADYAPGQAGAGVDLAAQAQAVEIARLEVTAFGPDVKLADLPHTRSDYVGIEEAAPWRKAAEARIEQLRKGDIAVTVVDADGRPVAGAAVRAKMTRHGFPFGTCVVASRIAGEEAENEKYRQVLVQNFNAAVLENDLKWLAWSGDLTGRSSRHGALQALAWLREQHFWLRGHVLVWPSFRYAPRAEQAFKKDKEALRAAISGHIRDVCGAVKGQVAEWDVVNEPFSEHDFMDVLGWEAVPDWYFLAREATGPGCTLYLNDYDILEAGGRTDTTHQDHFERTVKYLLDQGAPLGGLGLQGHFHTPVTPPETVLRIFDRYAAYGLDLKVTEFDLAIKDEELQAAYTRDLLTAAFSHPAITGFLFWGFWEGAHWRPDGALFRKDWSLKPNGAAYRDLVFRQWWTNAAGATGADGVFRTRGFLGEYEVLVRAGERQKAARATVSPGGLAVTIRLP